MKRRGIWIFAWAVIFLGYGLTKSRVDSRIKARQDAGVIRYLPSPALAEVLSFGFQNAVADIYWIEAINYFGAELGRKNRTLEYLKNFCDLIFKLDAYFMAFYEWAATAFIYNGLDVTHERIFESQRYINLGIQNMAKVHRYDSAMIVKGAFNYALELQAHRQSLPYFLLAARSFYQSRDMLLVASTYATYANELDIADQLKLEYLGHLAFESTNKNEIINAIQILSAPGFNSRSEEFFVSLRARMEKEDDVKKIVETRLKNRPTELQNINASPSDFLKDTKVENILSVDFTRTWLRPELHVLTSL